eukprot:CAMPEP_0119013056 /NCGR_PEP_ID=MMETSP1176-20130426/7811_1 /TAXON_ID=265551 /ORGANISM="Synedropsis recta cf, Strain CCMP1620" /LENGTH=147 /DNA_ID=CAMNT_0006966105 /DNA_START=56 /DNA_END=502 /DNA_ORIENTATION=-
MVYQSVKLLVVALCLCGTASALSVQPSRRNFMVKTFGVVSAAAMVVAPAFAEEGKVLTDEEMQARLARKKELQKKAASGQSVRAVSSEPGSPITDIRSDINPEAGTNLRSRSFVDNAKIAIDKQEEMKTRDKAQKREDMCEMLGRGC